MDEFRDDDRPSKRANLKSEATFEFVKALQAIQKVAAQLHEAQQFQQRLMVLKLQYLQEQRNHLVQMATTTATTSNGSQS